jgi:hypothetical protein
VLAVGALRINNQDVPEHGMCFRALPLWHSGVPEIEELSTTSRAALVRESILKEKSANNSWSEVETPKLYDSPQNQNLCIPISIETKLAFNW